MDWFAGYLSHRIRKIRGSLKVKEEQERERERFLNHHVRNALSSLQYAAHVTSDEKYQVRHANRQLSGLSGH